MRAEDRGKWAAALGSAAALLLLLLPVHLPPGGHAGYALGGVAHVGLFAGLAWLWARLMPARHRGWMLWVALALVSTGVEAFQSFAGRSPEWVDWLYGVGGAACICATWRWRPGIRWTAVWTLALIPPVWETAMVRMETRAFPVLAQPNTRWAGRGWMLNGVERAVGQSKTFRFRPAPGGDGSPYPGAFREPVCQDWRGVRVLKTALYWPAPHPALFAVRVDDLPGNPPYAERFQREFSVTQGWNDVRIPAEELARTSGGRPLRLESIRRWGVFLVSDALFEYFLLGPVRLDLQQESP